MKLKKQRTQEIIENLEIIEAASEGNSIAKHNELVIFIPFVVPGDIVDVQIIKKKKSFAQARAIKFHKLSDKRVEPMCPHFGVCGGCKWQTMKYEDQLFFKNKQVIDALQ
ncbi:MAG: TRAM domain-containing protein, partial [Bacteroidales bacterium]